MNYRLVIKILMGLLLVAALIFGGLKLINWLSDFIIDIFTGAELDDDYANELVTPEPLPTMPDYMGDDSFYDSAGSVEFNGE